MKPRITLVKFAAVSACALLLTACVSSQMPISPANDDVDTAPPPPTVTPNGTSDEQAASCDLEQSDSGARQVRVLRPGDMATMDHRPDRLNIHLDDQDVIEALRCG